MILNHCVLVSCVIFGTVSYVIALNKDDEGACTVKISSPRTRTKYISYYSSKWCGKKKCVARKTKKETYNVVKSQVVCCKGWEYNSTDDRCKPQCSTGCAGGSCVAPDVCTCNPPAYLDPERKNTCITPACQPACVNAICTQNNTCACKENYIPYNTSHCAKKCEPGFEIDPSTLECIHQCDQGCMNGKCVGPNICSCDNGFKLVNTFICEPMCEPECVNGRCIDANVCACNAGYKNTVDSWTCEPVCDSCDHGKCVGPNICECDVGYCCSSNTTSINSTANCENGDCDTEETGQCEKEANQGDRESFC